MHTSSLVVFALLMAADLWTGEQVMRPEELARTMDGGHAPVILMVGPRILYNGNHIRGAIYAGPASSESGVALLKQEIARFPANTAIVLYCGCCPMEKCPNIRPAFQIAHDAGFKNVKILKIPTNLHTDWTEKSYPVEKGSVPSNPRTASTVNLRGMQL